MLLQEFNLIPININIAIPSHNMEIILLEEKEKKNAHAPNLV